MVDINQYISDDDLVRFRVLIHMTYTKQRLNNRKGELMYFFLRENGCIGELRNRGTDAMVVTLW